MSNINDGVHSGHRQRMKKKLLNYGSRFFDTYELLEMLLYYVIPFKDTNPVAKDLLKNFSGTEGVFSASKEQLMQINGIKDKCADFLNDVGRAEKIAEISSSVKPKTVFDDYKKAGKFFVDYFEEEKKSNIVLVLLDNGMRTIAVENIPGENFGSGAVIPKYFLDSSVKYGASLVIVGYTHRNGLPFPYDADLVTGKLIKQELSSIGVSLVEQYVVGGGKYLGINTDMAFRYSNSPELARFIDSKKEMEPKSYFESANNDCCGLNFDKVFGDYSDLAKMTSDYIEKIISYSNPSGDNKKIAEELVKIYGSLDSIFDRSVEELMSTSLIKENTVLLLKLVAYISSRRLTDSFIFGKRHTDKEIFSYISSLYTGLSVETVYMLVLDEKDRVKGVEYIGEGTVNSSNVFPRKLAERAVKSGASSVILAHNHPGGVSKPSGADMVTTANLISMFRSFSIKLKYHVVVSGHNYTVLVPDDVAGKVRIDISTDS